MTKILLTVLVIYAIWFFFRHQKRIMAAHREVQEKKKAARNQAAPGANVPVAQDMVECPKCGAYVAADQPHTCEAPQAR